MRICNIGKVKKNGKPSIQYFNSIEAVLNGAINCTWKCGDGVHTQTESGTPRQNSWVHVSYTVYDLFAIVLSRAWFVIRV